MPQRWPPMCSSAPKRWRLLDGQRQAAENGVAAAREQATAAQTELAAAKAEVAKVSGQADAANTKRAALAAQVTALEADLAQAHAAVDAEGTARDRVAAELAQARTKLESVRAAQAEAQSQLGTATRLAALPRLRAAFGAQLHTALAGRVGVEVPGDRVVVRSDALFAPGTAVLSPAGREQVRALAAALKKAVADAPADVDWAVRVDGHADRQPMAPGGRFASNLDLSAARAIAVVRDLVGAGVPANRLLGTGFGDTQPLDPADTPAAYARNRRIELRLTER